VFGAERAGRDAAEQRVLNLRIEDAVEDDERAVLRHESRGPLTIQTTVELARLHDDLRACSFDLNARVRFIRHVRSILPPARRRRCRETRLRDWPGARMCAPLCSVSARASTLLAWPRNRVARRPV